MAQQGTTVTYSEGGFLDRFPWYVQLGVLLVAILIVVGAVDYFVMWQWREDADKKDQQAQELRRQNQEAEIIRQNIEAYTQTLEGLNAQLDSLKVRLPEQREVTNIFDNTKSLMTSSGLKLVQFQTNDKTKEVDKTYYTEVPSQVRVVGNYPNVQDPGVLPAAREFRAHRQRHGHQPVEGRGQGPGGGGDHAGVLHAHGLLHLGREPEKPGESGAAAAGRSQEPERKA
jgi:hypothetical protein